MTDTLKNTGCEAVYGNIKSLIEKDKLMHALVFSGGSPEAAAALSERLAREITDGHAEDIIQVKTAAGKSSITAGDIEALTEKLDYTPWGRRYAVIIYDAQLMNTQAQNKLLKTLEEPVSPAVIMLLSESRQALLATVLSRCTVYHLPDPLPKWSPDVKELAEKYVDLIIGGAPFYEKKAIIDELLKDKSVQRERSVEFLNILDELILQQSSGKSGAALLAAVRPVHDARRSVRLLHSPAYSMKKLCLLV